MTKLCALLVLSIFFWIGNGHTCDLKITELNAQSQSPWLEVFNSSEVTCNVSGLTISRIDGFVQKLAWPENSPQKNIIIPGGQYAVFSAKLNLGLEVCLKDEFVQNFYVIENKKFKFLKKSNQKICISGFDDSKKKLKKQPKEQLFDCVDFNFKKTKALSKTEAFWGESGCQIEVKNKIIYKGTPGYDNSMCLEITQACEKSREGSREELAGKRRDKIINLTYENLPDFKSISSLEIIDYENYKINIAQKFREKIKNNFSLIYPIEIFLNAYSSKQGKTRLANFDFSNMPFGTYDLEICAENIFGDVACEAQKEKLEILKERQKNKPEFAFRVISRETVGGTERILLGWESQNISRANVRIFEKNNPAKIIGLFSIEGDLSNQGQEVIYLSKDLRQPYGLTATLQGDFNTIVQEINEGN